MSELIFWSANGLLAVLVIAAGLLTVKGFGIARIGWLNFSRMKDLKQRLVDLEDPAEQKALQAVVNHCDTLRSKWVLDENDLDLAGNTRQLLTEVAGAWHPESRFPTEEARLGRLLSAFLELKDRILILSRIKGMGQLTRFRLRHVLLLVRAWKKKREWETSELSRAVSKYRVMFFIRWGYYLLRFMDLTFWTAKMAGYFLQQVAFKVLLIRWYLMVGELAMQVYRDREQDPDWPAEGLLYEIDTVSVPDFPSGFPPDVEAFVQKSRGEILYKVGLLEKDQILAIYRRLIEGVAHCHYPESDCPLYEARVFDLMMGLARFAGQIAEIRTKPFINKLLDIRLSHLLLARDVADYLKDSEVLSWVRKFPVGKIYKVSNLVYKTLRARHPGILFQDIAFTLVRETGKRWLNVYIHDKIALETNRIYGFQSWDLLPQPGSRQQAPLPRQPTSRQEEFIAPPSGDKKP